MHVILPLKEFAAAKQRLSGVLSAAERAQLFEAMVEDVLLVLTCHPRIKNIVICSRDQAARWLANYYGTQFIDESRWGAHDLNAAVNASVRALNDADVLVVHGDLPLLKPDEIDEFLTAHQNGQRSAVTLAPDRRGEGTNLLAWRGLPAFTATYGENSFARHCAQVRALNIEPAICELRGARCDMDEPEDLLLLLKQSEHERSLKSAKFLRDSGIAERLTAMRYSANSGDDRERA
jgi:2-phospho-L-lactate guanylyltransferase